MWILGPVCKKWFSTWFAKSWDSGPGLQKYFILSPVCKRVNSGLDFQKKYAIFVNHFFIIKFPFDPIKTSRSQKIAPFLEHRLSHRKWTFWNADYTHIILTQFITSSEIFSLLDPPEHGVNAVWSLASILGHTVETIYSTFWRKSCKKHFCSQPVNPKKVLNVNDTTYS